MECELKNLKFLDADLYKDKLLFYDSETAFFYSYDLIDRRISFVETKGVDENNKGIFRKVIRNGNFLYFIQSDDCVLYKYEQINSEFFFRNKIIVDNFYGGVKNAYLFNGLLWIIPRTINEPLAIIDLSNDVIEYCRFCTDNSEGNNKVIRDITLDDGILYIIYGNTEDLSIYNFYNKTWNTYKTGISNGVEGIIVRNENVILREKYGKRIYSWNTKRKESQLLATAELEFEEQGKLRLLSDGTIVICPIERNTFFYVNEIDGTIQNIQSDEEIKRMENATFTIETIEYDNALYIYPWAGESLVKIFKDGRNVKAGQIHFKMNKKKYADYYYNHKTKEIIEEHDNFSLKEFLQRI